MNLVSSCRSDAWKCILFIIATAAVNLTSTAGESLAAKRESGDAFFAGPIQRFEITLAPEEWQALQRENRKYVRATVKVGDKIFPEVGIHLKGAAGSFRPLEANPAVTLNFNKFVHEQEFHGLDKIHLNNSVQDPSMMTEFLCGELYRAAGIPSPRVTHARVMLNKRDLGLYVLKEGFDKSFLRLNFKDPNGNLYDGGFLRELTDGLQKTSGSNPEDRSDLKALGDAANEPDLGRRVDRLGKLLELDQFIHFIALDMMTWNWDGYAMKKNNYRLYHDPSTDRISFLSTGMDQMFWEPGGPIVVGFEGLVARSVMQVPELQRRYYQFMGELLTNIFKVDVMTNHLQWLSSRINPALAEYDRNAARNQANAANELRIRIIERARSIRQQLASLPKPLRFDASGAAAIENWVPGVTDPNVKHLERTVDGRKSLGITLSAPARQSASWRARVPLYPGHYRFEGNARTAGPRAAPEYGALLRISGVSADAVKRLAGNSTWTPLRFDFDVAAQQEVVLVCELRGSQGEADFEFASLRVVRMMK